MFKAILVSLSLMGWAQPMGPTDRYKYTISNITYSITSNDPLVAREVSAKIKKMEKEITERWLDGPIPKGMRHIRIYVCVRNHNRAYCTPDLKIYIASNRDHFDETLKHELTHALLFIRYPNLSRWAHEGVATSWDGPGDQKVYSQVLAWSRRSGTYPILEQVMIGKRFTSRNSTAYATSRNLVKFLLTKGDRHTLFLYATGKCNLQRAYGFRDITEMQVAWVRWLNRPAVAQKP